MRDCRLVVGQATAAGVAQRIDHHSPTPLRIGPGRRMVMMHVPRHPRHAARFVAERSSWNLPVTDITPSTESPCAGLGQSGPHMATGLPHPWNLRPVTEPYRDRMHGVKGVGCGRQCARHHDQETMSWSSRAQAHGHVRRTRQGGGGAALRSEFQGEAKPVPSLENQPTERPDLSPKTGPGRSTANQPEPNSTGAGLPAIGFLRTNPVHRDIGPPR